ncbi:glycoside hydrolase family 43 protein [Mucilaginibacter roseus]|uniref:Glycoside hydrolase family 43 protein n=1 Tax=Mucilaginibacter roseus TaxID=1528868 RepID=A0ABS8TY25_9SPHI|nr:glycoside hydrolase family 43 protein [Mucilaginibacter roseus]MCD8739267.1 glycoside hydrolase family 43 protein [Mucilaginibacter roseus]
MSTLNKMRFGTPFYIAALGVLLSCNSSNSSANKNDTATAATDTTAKVKFLSPPLVKDIYTADPSAHVFNGKIYIYPSHDYDAGIKENDNGDHFAMKDYHIFSMDSIGGPVTDHGVALDVKDIPWAGRQLWAPDVAYKSGTYYLYFPLKNKQDVFQIGVATSKNPAGPFKAEHEPIAGSYSIDPAVFTDTDGKTYMYFGGIWGGQLQQWANGKRVNDSKTDLKNDDAPALSCKVVRLKDNMKEFDGAPQDAVILDSLGKPLLGKDHDRRFFEGSWMHKYDNKYYFTYSTGDTHLLCYAVGDSPMGPFTYKGVLMKPVQGWTTHHSIIEFKGKWYIFYHDTELSGKTHLRNIKVTELTHNADGTIAVIDPFIK